MSKESGSQSFDFFRGNDEHSPHDQAIPGPRQRATAIIAHPDDETLSCAYENNVRSRMMLAPQMASVAIFSLHRI
jgi:hypothetical protein